MAKSRKSKFHWKRWLILLALLGVLGVCVVYGVWACTFDMKDVEKMPEWCAVYDMDGKLYSRLRGENRIIVSLDEVSPDFVKALLAREDSRFFKHHGVDPFGILRAVVRNIIRMHAKEGASTITQQLARNSFTEGIGSKRSLHRKILEAFVAMRIEQNFTKKQILENYINRIYFGSGYWGVETACQAYFGKPAAKMNLSESAMLVGLIRSPNRFSPFKNPKGALIQRDTVLARMKDLDMITDKQAEAAIHARPAIQKKPPAIAQDNYAMDLVRRDLDVLLSNEQLDTGGLRIYTTIDPDLQRTAIAAVDAQIGKIEQRSGYSHPRKSQYSEEDRKARTPTPYLQGALVAIDNRDGGIRAIVGGRDYADSHFNRAIEGQRQIGSTFKPFVYAAAFNGGLLPTTAIDDSRIQPGELRTASGNWSPDNSDNNYKGLMPTEEGLIHSRNTMSVRVGDRAGLDEVERVSSAVGLGEVPRGAASFIGSFETNLRDLTVAYSVFPNNGVRRQSYIIERIDDADGNVLYRAAHIEATVMDPAVTWMVSSILSKVMERGTAAAARSLGFNKPAAGKTGTTNDYRDAWFVGYTKSLTCGVWVGLDQPQTIVPRGYGAALALPIWTTVMNAAAPARYPSPKFDPPVELQRVEVCSVSGALATAACSYAGAASVIELPVTKIPRGTCPIHQEIAPAEDLKQQFLRSFQRFFGGRR